MWAVLVPVKSARAGWDYIQAQGVHTCRMFLGWSSGLNAWLCLAAELLRGMPCVEHHSCRAKGVQHCAYGVRTLACLKDTVLGAKSLGRVRDRVFELCTWMAVRKA